MQNHPNYKAPRTIEERLNLPCGAVHIYIPGTAEDGPRPNRFKWAMENAGQGQLSHCKGHGTFSYRFAEPQPSTGDVIKSLISSGLPISRLYSSDSMADWDYKTGETKKFLLWEKSDIHMASEYGKEEWDSNLLR